MNELEKVSLSDSNKVKYEERLAEIEIDLQKKLEDSNKLRSYMSNIQEDALILERQEQDELKMKGILVGTHIPAMQSKLIINQDILKSQKSVSFDFVIPRAIIEDNNTNSLRRIGQLPVSQGNVEYNLRRTQNKAAITSDIPHYWATTDGFKVRETLTRLRRSVANLDSPKDYKKTTETTSIAKSNQTTKKGRNVHLSMAEKEENRRIVHSMTSKLNYQKNPRNLNINAIPKTLIRTLQPLHHNKRDDNPIIFLAEPSSLTFFGYEIGEEKTLTLTLRNVSTVLRSVRCLPPTMMFFSMSALQYPLQCKGGLLAPGMSVTIQIRFISDSLRDFEDFLMVETESGSFSVPLKATRLLPQLSLPSIINVGNCLLGDAIRIEIPIFNSGGPARFMLFGDDESTALNSFDVAKYDSKQSGSIRILPFNIYPAAFELQANENINIYVEFVPLSLGKHSRHFRILGDNLKTRDFTVVGEAQQIQVYISNVNTVPVNTSPMKNNNSNNNNMSNVHYYTDLHFPSVVVDEESMQSFEVENQSGLALEFEWLFIDASLQGELFDSQCLAKLAASELSYDNYIFSREKSGGGGVGSDPGGESFLPGSFPSMFNDVSEANNNNTNMNHMLVLTTPAGQHDNILKEDPFSIYPRRGLFPAHGNIHFDVTYNPARVESSSLMSQLTTKAVLMLKRIPLVALPQNIATITAISSPTSEYLPQHHHPPFYKLLSWTETLGKRITLPDSTVVDVPYISLQSLLDLVRSYATSPDTSDAVVEFQNRVTKILKYFQLWLKGELDINSSEDESDVERDSGGNQNSGSKLLPIMIRDGRDVHTEFSQVLFKECDIYATKLNYDGDGGDDSFDSIEYYNQNNELTCIYVENTYIITIFGNLLCTLLESNVSHEAVQYLQEMVQTSASIIQVQLYGNATNARVITVQPSQITCNQLTIGKVWSTFVTIQNSYDAIIELILRPEYISVYSLETFEMLHPHTDYVITFSNIEVILMSESTVQLEMTLQMKRIGIFEVRIAWESTAPYTKVEQLIVQVESIAPKLRFNMPEIYFGLLSVGKSEKVSLVIMNESDVPLQYVVQTSIDTDTELQNAILARMSSLAMSGSTGANSKVTTARGGGGGGGGGGYSHRSQQQQAHRNKSTGRSDRSRDSFNLTELTAVVAVDCPAGRLAPHESISVTFAVTGGALSQRLRGLMKLTVFDISGSCQLPPQLLTLRGEIQSPHVVIRAPVVDLGDVYFGESCKFNIYLENLTNLPSKFKIQKLLPDQPLFSLVFQNPEGPIGPKEIITIQGELHAFVEDVSVDCIVGCKYFGAQDPLAFQIKATLKPFRVDFTSDVNDTNISAQVMRIESLAHEVFTPGSPAVKLHERCNFKFLIRNLSGSHLSFSLKIAKFFITDNHQDNGVKTGNHIKAINKSLICMEEPKDKIYNSERGKAYIQAKLMREEDRLYLDGGNGMACRLTPSVGRLNPWSCQIFLLEAFNDSPASYEDEIMCVCKSSNGAEKTYSIPYRMLVID